MFRCALCTDFFFLGPGINWGLATPLVIRGHHIYKSRWTPLLGEALNTSFELDNEHNKYAVRIAKSVEIVGHVRRSISKLMGK